jgi:hypothetical protein
MDENELNAAAAEATPEVPVEAPDETGLHPDGIPAEPTEVAAEAPAE